MSSEKTAVARVKRKEKKNIVSGVAHVNSTFNNTMITISDAQGNVVAWSSAGLMGFKGSRKSTPYAAQMAAEDAGQAELSRRVRQPVSARRRCRRRPIAMMVAGTKNARAGTDTSLHGRFASGDRQASIRYRKNTATARCSPTSAQ